GSTKSTCASGAGDGGSGSGSGSGSGGGSKGSTTLLQGQQHRKGLFMAFHSLLRKERILFLFLRSVGFSEMKNN
ncbi:hypothetical protein, partial [Enterococcus larvae]|uniref:hypothetical protein n=1 Tax=Enterococcus larvae TaxID=2794352 RepID=UPI003F32D6FF